eukprot:TRINITY_DN18867_c0_g1_i1.p1 TRINITY_DN18867_c0_g1~~TRINITY_DN18867_c0_g1_i1.p1  ORF type:complete len:269 (+),score=19.01 TRINITY_DN18867_c0_g1_i1:65-808(+)
MASPVPSVADGDNLGWRQHHHRTAAERKQQRQRAHGRVLSGLLASFRKLSCHQGSQLSSVAAALQGVLSGIEQHPSTAGDADRPAETVELSKSGATSLLSPPTADVPWPRLAMSFTAPLVSTDGGSNVAAVCGHVVAEEQTDSHDVVRVSLPTPGPCIASHSATPVGTPATTEGSEDRVSDIVVDSPRAARQQSHAKSPIAHGTRQTTSFAPSSYGGHCFSNSLAVLSLYGVCNTRWSVVCRCCPTT